MPEPRFLANNAGRFISRGRGRHETRRIVNWELIFVVTGALDMFEESAAFRVEAGERLLLRPGRRHGGLSAYPRALSFYWLHFTPANGAAKACLGAMDAHAAITEPALFSAYWPLLLAEQRLRAEAPDTHGRAMDHLTAILIAGCITAGAVATSPGFQRLAEDAARYIMTHYADPITTSDIARHLRCHPDYLGRVFHTARGMTIGDALRRARIAAARRYLEETQWAVKEVARRTGYRDAAYFRQQFIRESGVSPRRYRLLHSTGYFNTDQNG